MVNNPIYATIFGGTPHEARYSTGIAMQAVRHFPDVNDVDV